jgi:serine/threonine protein kinase
MNYQGRFKEDQTKFFIANILLALEYLHSRNILHRDVKPENLVFDRKGYLKLCDFGISRKLKDGKVLCSSGTPSYMAPEVINREYHGVLADFYAVGVIAYECMLGIVS